MDPVDIRYNTNVFTIIIQTGGGGINWRKYGQ